MLVQKIKKRNGNVVDFQPEKITTAMEKAMVAVLGKADPEKLAELTERVLGWIEIQYGEEGIPQVEVVQDYVERALMESGFYDVVKAYILYRERHRELREEKQKEILEKIEERAFFVIKRSGASQIFDERKLRIFFQRISSGFEGVVDVERLVEYCKVSIHEGIRTDEISQLAVMTAKAFIESDPSYSVITTKAFLSALYKEAVGERFSFAELLDVYRQTFVRNIETAIEFKKLTPDLLNFDLRFLSQHLNLERDSLFSYRGLQLLYDRYFICGGKSPRRLETPQAFWMRVAMGLALNEKEKEKWAIEFYNVLSSFRFVSSTPTLFHAGSLHPQLSSCYLNTAEDDLNHIFKVFSDNAQLARWSGGLGTDWSNLRASGALIKSIGVETQGVVPYLKISNDINLAINRSGKRRGAACAYLETWHLDVEDFLDLRRNTGDERRRTHDMNTANWVPDLFIKRVLADEGWTLFSPDEVPELHHLYGRAFEERYVEYEKKASRGEIKLWKRLRAKELWKKMITRLFETGHPWLTFKDPCNIRSPQDHVGVVHSSNLCTEITLNTSKEETAVCNLGSVNFAKHVVDGKLSPELLEQTVTLAMRLLDNVIDVNFYPTAEAKNSNLRHRPVGLGIMGFQDALFLLDVNFDSEEAVEFADESMELVSYYAILASSKLAKERGAYVSFRGSKWDRGIFPVDTLDLLERERGIKIEVSRSGKLNWEEVRQSVKKYGLRNSNCLAIAPTATIADICGCFPTIEPIYKNLYVRSNMSGEFTVENQYLVEDLKSLGLWNQAMLEEIKQHDGSIQKISAIPQKLKDKYKEAFEIEPEWLVKIAAHRGKWIDQSQSLNIFSTSTSGRRIADVYLYAWKMGLKSTYYLRSIGASAIEKSTVDLKLPKLQTLVSEELLGSGQTGALSSPTTVETEKAKVSVLQTSLPTATLLDSSSSCPVDDPDCEACQ